MATSNRAPAALVPVRVQTFFATWFHVTLDVGHVYGAAFDDWDHRAVLAHVTSSVRAQPASARSATSLGSSAGK